MKNLWDNGNWKCRILNLQWSLGPNFVDNLQKWMILKFIRGSKQNQTILTLNNIEAQLI